MVSSKSGSGSVSVSVSSTRDPRHSTRDDRQGRPRFRHRRSLFRVSGFRVSGFHPNRGRYRYRYRNRLFNHEHTGWHRSGFYPQIYADCADFLGIARVFWNARGEFLIFMKFHVFHGFIQIGVAIGIGIGIVDPRPATFDPRRSTGTPAFPTPQVAFQGFWFQGFWFLVSGFHPNRGRDRYRDRNRLFNHEHTGWHRSGFLERQGGIPDFHEVSCVSRFHPNRGRDRYRYRDRDRLLRPRSGPQRQM